jgi:hypothetical protein
MSVIPTVSSAFSPAFSPAFNKDVLDGGSVVVGGILFNGQPLVFNGTNLTYNG